MKNRTSISTHRIGLGKNQTPILYAANPAKWFTGFRIASLFLCVLVAPYATAQTRTTVWGYNAATTGNYQSNFGAYAGTNGVNENSNAGVYCGQDSKGDKNSNCGATAGAQSSGDENSNFGGYAGRYVSGGKNCNFGFAGVTKPKINMTGDSNFGYQAEVIGQENTTVASSYNCRFGAFTVGAGTKREFVGSILFGANAGTGMVGGNDNVLIGAYSGPTTSALTHGLVCLGYGASNKSVSVPFSVYLGYGAQARYEGGAAFNPLYDNRPSFTVNNQVYNGHPLLFGYFAQTAAHTDIQTTNKQQAQLAINTSYVKTGMTLTVDGPAYIGDFYKAGYQNTAIRKELMDRYGLFVERGILSEDFAIASVEHWADYVFDSDYNLRSLDEVAAYIKDNKHLPGIPSADELAREGMSVKDMYKNFMEKIEELTLYTIQQEKWIEKGKRDNAKLEQQLAELQKAIDAYKSN